MVATQASGSKILIQDIPGKGKGVISRQYFSKGDIVHTERPLLTQSLARNNSTVLSALASCTPLEQSLFYQLHNCHGARYPRELGIFETNVLPCGSNDSHGHVAAQGGLFLFAARFNSSCAPNLTNRWDADRGVVVLRALRDIAPGEELCIGYGNLLASRASRREELRRKFGFKCACDACALEGQELEESDERRRVLNQLYAAHTQGLCEDPIEGIGQAMLALQYLRLERLPVYSSAFYFSGFHFCAAVSDFKSAVVWAAFAQRASRVAFGEQAAERWRRLVDDPTTYEDAGRLGKMTLAAPDAQAWAFLGLSL
ncbi:SET domain-containing protein [Trametopsis cervina]|nr:SET domain-containing protein [Trametopsis cervina]